MAILYIFISLLILLLTTDFKMPKNKIDPKLKIILKEGENIKKKVENLKYTLYICS